MSKTESVASSCKHKRTSYSIVCGGLDLYQSLQRRRVPIWSI